MCVCVCVCVSVCVYIYIYILHLLFPFISVDRHLGGLYVLTITHSASVNFGVHVCGFCFVLFCFVFLNYGFLKVYASNGVFNVKNNQ